MQQEGIKPSQLLIRELSETVGMWNQTYVFKGGTITKLDQAEMVNPCEHRKKKSHLPLKRKTV